MTDSALPDWAMPLDFAILSLLPAQGSRLGYHVLGSTVKVVKERLNEPMEKEAWVSSDIISSRIRNYLRPQGMVVEVKVMGAGGNRGYQITPAGEALLAANPDKEQA